MSQAGFFDFEQRLDQLNAHGNPLHTLERAIDFEAFRPTLARVREKPTASRTRCADGPRIDWPDRWVHVRPSNTEPILRIIAEAATRDKANELIAAVRETI